MRYRAYRLYMAAAVCLLLLAAFWQPAASAVESFFVNDGDSVLTGSLKSAYVVGADGKPVQLGRADAYALSARGLEAIGSADSVVPQHLSVTGRVELKYDKVRVGLYYYDGESSVRNTTLDSANLENAVGSGYRFGYFDEERNFVELGYTEERAITMVKDKNVSLTHGSVGCYHILLPGTYDSFEAALRGASDYEDGFAAWYEGSYRALAGQYESAADADADMSARGIDGMVYTASRYCVTVVRSSDARVIFEFDGGGRRNLAVSPQGNGRKAETWFKGFRYYGDFEYVRRTGDKLTVINVVDIEDYVKGILPYEMNAAWPEEALKAQAVCARSYAVTSFDSQRSYGFDVTNDAYSQVYRGMNSASARSDAAVDATSGIYATYEGKIISAVYSSSFGGGSEDSENVFGNSIPYLRGVSDPFEAAADSINAKSSWTFSYTASELTRLVNSSGSRLSEISGIDVTYSATDNVIGITFRDDGGRTASFSRSECYKLCTGTLGLHSIHFTVEQNGSRFIFRGGGWGHNIGMSQYGAYAMARSYSYTYDQIIGFYYTGVSLSYGSAD